MDFKHTSIKQSALGWVKKSIDDNLANIRAELNVFIENNDSAILESVKSQLGDLQGVLTMIEQYGASMLTEEMGSLCKYIASKPQLDETALEVLLRAVLQLPDYLEHIQAGYKDIPIAILPLLNDIRAAKNEDLFSEKLLFLPDLSMHTGDSEYDSIDEAKNQSSRLLAKKIRPSYQYSLLGVIRDQDVDTNLARLGKISSIMEERSSSEQVARFWWIVGALIESVARDNLPLGVSVKMLMGKVDQALRITLLKGEKALLQQQPIELIKNLLYYIAQPECDGPKSQAIKTAYRLEQFLPVEKEPGDSSSGIAGPNQELLKTVSDAIQADLEQVKSALEVYVTGDLAMTDQLKLIPKDLHVISDTLAMIGLGPQRQVIEAQIKMINDVVEGVSPPDHDKLLEMAAELIQIDQALELLHKGQLPKHGGEDSAPTVASRNFEMDNMLSAVVTAALDDIQKIKDAILDFIKDPTKEENLQLCQTLLMETRGAMELLNQNNAVSVVEGLVTYLREQDIVEFMDTHRLDQLSQVVVSIEYFLEALGEQRTDADSILDFAETQLQILLEGKLTSAKASKDNLVEQENLLIDDEEDFEIIDEQQLADVDLANMDYELGIESSEPAQAEGEPAEAGAIKEVVTDIRDDLEQIQDVLLVEDEEVRALDSSDDGFFADQSIEIESSLEQDIEQMPDMEELDEDSVDLAPEADEENELPELVADQAAQVPETGIESEATPTTIQVTPVHDDLPVLKPGSDEEILDIYLEEAEEESGNIIQLQKDWKLHPEDENALKNIRRSFHTIKGSGRLVGAMKIGEFAWDYESLLNRVIEKTVAPSDQVIDAIGLAAEALPQLVEELKTNKAPTADIAYLRGLARSLAEFKADHVLEIRQTPQQIFEATTNTPIVSEQSAEEAIEEPEPEQSPGEVQSLAETGDIDPEPQAEELSVELVAPELETAQDDIQLDDSLEIEDVDFEPAEDVSVESVAPELEAAQDDIQLDDTPEIEDIDLEPAEDLSVEPVASELETVQDDIQLDDSPEIEDIDLESAEDLSVEPVASEIDLEDVEDSAEPVEPFEALVSEDELSPQDEQLAAENGLIDNTVEQEETPPDPFVLDAIAEMPGGEVESTPSENSLQQPETNDLQIDPELLIIYQQEVESHLNTVNSVLEASQASGELIPTEELYRSLHTINGASRTADITTIGNLATLLEKPLKILLEQGSALDEDSLDLYRQGHDAILSMTRELVEHRRMPEPPKQLEQDLQSLLEQMDDHTVELPAQNNQPSNQFVDTLTMMNETATSGSGYGSEAESDFDDELVEIFIEEATDLLEMSDHTLQSWSEQDENEDSQDYGLVMELQRYLHTLKGGAKMADFSEISDLSHELESLFIALIDNRVEKTDELIDTLHESFDQLQRQVDQAKNHQQLESSEQQINHIKKLRGIQAAPIESEDSSVEEELITEQAETAAETTSGVTDEALKETAFPETPAPKQDAHSDRRSADRDVVKVRSELLDNLVNSAGEVSIYRARMEQQVSSFGSHLGELGQTITRLKKQLRDLEAETDAQIHFSHRQDAEQAKDFDPLEMDRYTQIQQLSKSLSESVDDLSSLQSILGDQVKDSETLLLQQSRINTDLQDGLIRSRMVRFSGLTSRLRRLVRQTSSELGKKAELKLSGEQNEVDIKVLDRMVAPLEHIIRNAISHGIESPMERVKKGKPETGTILIAVSRDGSDVVLRISDDGAGVNVDKVRSRALQLGLLSEHESIEDNDVIQFILEPGFSTAEQVSQVSGRGVGMDVVDTGIKQLGGTLQISTSSNGTVFTARLPFTLSINQAILVRAGEESYALPLINIEGITRIEADQMFDFYQQEKPMLDYAGQQYSLHYLSVLVDVASGYQMNDAMAKVPVILLRSGDLRIALHIDEILGNREIVVKPLGVHLSQVKGLSGASILADGKVVLILDINGLIRHGVSTHVVSQSDKPVKHDTSADADRRKTVMVVDDSITMRRVATKLLTRHHYDVVTAKDGVDALAQLEEANPDIMLLDIEMPRMDGFELALHMRNEARYRNIPIIMITSRTGSKHRDHAMELGVSKYMGKPYQEAELIENIAELVG